MPPLPEFPPIHRNRVLQGPERSLHPPWRSTEIFLSPTSWSSPVSLPAYRPSSRGYRTHGNYGASALRSSLADLILRAHRTHPCCPSERYPWVPLNTYSRSAAPPLGTA